METTVANDDTNWKNEAVPYLTRRPVANNWYRVKKSDIPAEILLIHKNNLTIRSFVADYITDKELPPRICYEEDGEDFCVPYYYGICNFGSDFLDLRHVGNIDKTRMVQFEGKLDEKVLNQVSASEAILKSLLHTTHSTALLALPPGTGKTTTALQIWTEVCKYENGVCPVLCLVHMDHLIDQWIERIKQFVPEARIGMMRGKIMDYENKDIVLCTVQSLITYVKDKNDGILKPRYSQELLKRFSMLIIDEAHHISASKFCKSFPLTAIRRILLLTGTPHRLDRGEKVAESWIGGITFQTKRTYTCPVFVKYVYPEYGKMEIKLNFKRKADYNKMVKDLVDCEARNNAIVDEVEKLFRDNRQILLLSDRCDKVPHLHMLKELLEKKYPDITSAFFYGKTKKKDRIEALKARVILSSYKMAAEALDIPTLSALVFATPKPNVEQAALRIVRGKHQVLDPIIIDFQDPAGLWQGYARKRRKYYDGEGFKIIKTDLKDIEKTEIDDVEKHPTKRKTDDYPETRPSKLLKMDVEDECGF
jgi:superfamily II DNA or RNA helicase